MFGFDHSVPNKEVNNEMGLKEYEPCNFLEILAFGQKYPELQRQFPVVALKAMARSYGRLSVAVLTVNITNKNKRSLELFGLYGLWHKNYRFLGVKK